MSTRDIDYDWLINQFNHVDPQITEASSVSGALTLDFSKMATTVTLTEHISSINFTGAITGTEGTVTVYFTQGGTGSYTVNSSQLITAAGGVIDISSAVGTKSVLVFSTLDGGSEVYAFNNGSNWS